MIAIVSDIHSNTEALSRVFADIESQGIRSVYCLGDVIGYGPEPRETLEMVIERCEWSILGNHEHGAMFYASDFNPKARAAIEWTKERLSDPSQPRELNFKLWNYISAMPEKKQIGDLLFVHGSPLDPVRDYTLPSDVSDPDRMRARFERMGEARLCFVGHSHVPGVYEEGGGYRSPAELDGRWQAGEARAIVNVGSVGQPRDGDPRSCYVVYDPQTRTVTWRRIVYDVEKTMEKIRASALPDYLADRLAVGR